MKTLIPIAVAFALAASCDSPSAADPAIKPAAESAPAPSTSPASTAETPTMPSTESVYALEAKTLSGEAIDLDKYAGKVTVFVNVASKCGYTPQYKGLQELHEELGGEVHIVGVPSNDFGGQEPGSADEIAAFCQENYGVTFDMLEKVGTKEGASPLFDRLAALTGERPGWNFCKYVVSKDGTEATFLDSKAKPGGPELASAIAAYQTK